MALQKKNSPKTKKVAMTKRADPKKIAAKNMTKGHPGGKAEKEKIVSKMANKSYARKDTMGSTKATTKSGMQRAKELPRGVQSRRLSVTRIPGRRRQNWTW